MKVFLILIALAGVIGCERKGSPTGPGTTAQSQPDAQSPQPGVPILSTSSYEGIVTETVTDRVVAGAAVTLQGTTAMTDAAGRFAFMFPGPQRLPAAVKIDGPHHITRETQFRDSATLDLISLSPPFKLRLYEELVRGTFDYPGESFPVERWVTAPAIAINPFTISGRPVAPEALNAVERSIRDAFPLWTGGALSFSRIERRAIPADTKGWIAVTFNTRTESRCGQAMRSWTQHALDAVTIELSINDACSCGSVHVTPRTTAHELGHALGFEHVSDTKLTMAPEVADACNRTERTVVTDVEAHHAALAYRRPVGNMAPDRDPVGDSTIGPHKTSRVVD